MVMFDCDVHGVPPPQIKWHRLHQPGREGEEKSEIVRVFQNGSFLISCSGEEEEGLYQCTATNSLNEIRKTVSLDVQVGAEFRGAKTVERVRLGQKAVLECAPQGDQPIRVSWSRHGNKISTQHQNYFKIRNDARSAGSGAAVTVSRLIIRQVKMNDSAEFSCLAENSFGRANATIVLIVEDVPDRVPQLTVLDYGSRAANLSWVAPSDNQSPITRYTILYKPYTVDTWQDAGKETLFGSVTQAMLSGLQPNTIYTIKIRAENSVGAGPASEKQTIKTLEEAPEGPPLNVIVKPQDSETLKLLWKAPAKDLQHSKIIGYYIGYKATDQNEPYQYKTVPVKEEKGEPIETMELLLENLDKYTRYSVLIQAYNKLGTGPKNVPEVVVKTDEDVPSSSPTSLSCSSISSTSVHLSWNPLEAEEFNGISQGYVVYFRPLREWQVGESIRLHTLDTLLTVKQLEKFQNYTVQVAALTRIGEGLKSRPVYCRTMEDVPSAPANIRAVPLSTQSILVTWLPPVSPAGDITGYAIHLSTMMAGQPITDKIEVFNSKLEYIIMGLTTNQPYSICVTAFTIVGEGGCSGVVVETPRVPQEAVISSIQSHHHSLIHSPLTLPCRAVGNPKPSVTWTCNDTKIDFAYEVLSDGDLLIEDLKFENTGNFTCSIINMHGQDSITHSLTVHANKFNGVPPSPPTPRVTAERPNSLTVEWSDHLDGGSPVTSYQIFYREQFNTWKLLQTGQDSRRKLIKNLKCGTEYEVYMLAVNSLGAGKHSDIVKKTTLGTLPKGPGHTDLLALNTTWIGLNLHTWSDGNCPISSFVIEYSLSNSESWILVSNNVLVHPTSKQMFVIHDLQPSTGYRVRITAHNAAGSSVNTYSSTTLPSGGANTDTVLAAGGGITPEGIWSVWSVCVLVSLALVLVSTGVYVIHMTVHKLLLSKAGQPAAEQHVNNQCQYDPYGQYHEMRQLHQQETLMPVTPAHTALNNEMLNNSNIQSNIYADPSCAEHFTFYQPFYPQNTWAVEGFVEKDFTEDQQHNVSPYAVIHCKNGYDQTPRCHVVT